MEEVMELLKVGERTELLSGYPQEATVFEIDESGLNLFLKMPNLTQSEIKSFSAGSQAEFRFVRVDGILFILFKLGDMPWMDSPYAIQFSRCASLPKVPDGAGYALNMVLIDGVGSIVRGLRLISLSNRFSNALRDEILRDADSPIVRPLYFDTLGMVYRKYTTKELVKLASNKFKVR